MLPAPRPGCRPPLEGTLAAARVLLRRKRSADGVPAAVLSALVAALCERWTDAAPVRTPGQRCVLSTL
jgi:hypothetical protein